MKELTHNFLELEKDESGEYKTLLDAELKYKLCYFKFSDIRVKRMEKIIQNDITRRKIAKLDHELRKELDELCRELNRIGETSFE